jgi:cysteine desulfurase
MDRLYCDYNATTPLHPQVLARMMAAASQCFGNPSSQHSEGRQARQLVEQARAQVASLIAAHPHEIVFTSGGTESNNLALGAVAQKIQKDRGRPLQVISSPLEHPSVRNTLAGLAEAGCQVRELPCDPRGRLHVDELARLLKDQPADLLSLALCNHELGNVYPIAELAGVAHAHGVLVHCDAVAATGRMPVSVGALDIDLLSVSAHKLCGPKGVGALYVRAARPSSARRGPSPAAQSAIAPPPSLADLAPLLRGGPQERGLRPGTENLLGIIGFGAAAELAQRELLPAWQALPPLRDKLAAQLQADIADCRINGDADRQAAKAPGTLNVAFARVEGELLMMNLDLRGIAVSTGSACSSGSVKPSPVLLALGQSAEQARQATRISLGPHTTPADIQRISRAIFESVAQVRAV